MDRATVALGIADAEQAGYLIRQCVLDVNGRSVNAVCHVSDRPFSGEDRERLAVPIRVRKVAENLSHEHTEGGGESQPVGGPEVAEKTSHYNRSGGESRPLVAEDLGHIEDRENTSTPSSCNTPTSSAGAREASPPNSVPELRAEINTVARTRGVLPGQLNRLWRDICQGGIGWERDGAATGDQLRELLAAVLAEDPAPPLVVPGGTGRGGGGGVDELRAEIRAVAADREISDDQVQRLWSDAGHWMLGRWDGYDSPDKLRALLGAVKCAQPIRE